MKLRSFFILFSISVVFASSLGAEETKPRHAVAPKVFKQILEKENGFEKQGVFLALSRAELKAAENANELAASLVRLKPLAERLKHEDRGRVFDEKMSSLLNKSSEAASSLSGLAGKEKKVNSIFHEESKRNEFNSHRDHERLLNAYQKTVEARSVSRWVRSLRRSRKFAKNEKQQEKQQKEALDVLWQQRIADSNKEISKMAANQEFSRERVEYWNNVQRYTSDLQKAIFRLHKFDENDDKDPLAWDTSLSLLVLEIETLFKETKHRLDVMHRRIEASSEMITRLDSEIQMLRSRPKRLRERLPVMASRAFTRRTSPKTTKSRKRRK